MKRNIILFLQIILILIGIGTLAFLLWEPHTEGRNVHATLFEIYFKDPFLAYAYIGSIPFFAAIYQLLKVLNNTANNKLFSTGTIKALRTVQYCALTIIGFAVGAELYFFTLMRFKDDVAGGVAMGLFIILLSILVTTVAAIYERRIRNSVQSHSGQSSEVQILH